jgi:hypothetical protein
MLIRPDAASLATTRPGVIHLTGAAKYHLHPPGQLIDQDGQLEQVLGPEPRPTGGQDEERVWTVDVRPTRRQRADASLARFPEEDPVLTPRVGEPEQLELLTPQRMERVRDLESLRIVAVASS